MNAVAIRIAAAKRLREAAQHRERLNLFRGAERERPLSGFPDFAAHQLRIVDRRGKLVRLKLNPLQQQIYRAEMDLRQAGKRPWLLILKYRKGGVTTMQQGMSYHAIWSEPHVSCVTFAHRADDTRSIFRMVSRFHDNQPPHHRHGKTSASVHHIEFPAWDSWYKAETASARGPGRGSTMRRIHLSEAAFYKDLPKLHTALVESQDERCAYIWETTPNGKTGNGQAFYEFWQSAKRGENAFTPLFFPWHSDASNAMPLDYPGEMDDLTDEEARMQIRFGLTLEQVKWWRVKRKELKVGARAASAIYQEHPNDDESCFMSQVDGYYDGDLIEEAYQQCRPPIQKGDLQGDYPEWIIQEVEHGRLRIFEEPREGARYVVGSDPAEGVGGDDSAAVGFNIDTGEQAFTWCWNRLPPDVFGATVLGGKEGLGWTWRGGPSGDPAYMVVERENHGHAVLTGLLRVAKYPKGFVHHETDLTKDDPKASDRAGWRHNHVQLTTAVGRLLRESFPIIRDNETVASIQAVSNDNGTAQFGGRDRAVAAGAGAIGMMHATGKSSVAFIGGQLVDLRTGKPVDG